ncbi:MAG: tRNA 2-thiocytidine(32) synthetase TtcA [Pseudomonadota bacterium]
MSEISASGTFKPEIFQPVSPLDAGVAAVPERLLQAGEEADAEGDDEVDDSAVDDTSPVAIAKKAKTNFNKLQKRLRREVGQAIADFNMIEEGDKIMVCLSGGKDSYTMLDILRSLQRDAPVNFELFAVNLDQKQPGFPEHVIPEYLKKEGVPFHIIEEDTYSVVKSIIPEGKTTCSLCSRLRRGNLYTYAEEIGATKIALGHHRDDIMETLFLNMFYGGKLKSMPPKLLSDNGKHVVIRPLAYCREKDIIRFAEYKQFPIIPCNLCGSQENLQRNAIKAMLQEWDRKFPGRLETIFSAVQNVVPSHLADTELFDFKNLTQMTEQERAQAGMKLDLVNLF